MVEIVLVLSGQTRNRAIAFCPRAMTADAGGHALRGNAFSVYLLAGSYFWRNGGFAGHRGLGGIEGSDGIDAGIVQMRDQAPHREVIEVVLRVWCGARVIAKVLQLRDDVILMLTGEARKLRRSTSAVRAVTGRAE